VSSHIFYANPDALLGDFCTDFCTDTMTSLLVEYYGSILSLFNRWESSQGDFFFIITRLRLIKNLNPLVRKIVRAWLQKCMSNYYKGIIGPYRAKSA
jgi:hypothetical protein